MLYAQELSRENERIGCPVNDRGHDGSVKTDPEHRLQARSSVTRVTFTFADLFDSRDSENSQRSSLMCLKRMKPYIV